MTNEDYQFNPLPNDSPEVLDAKQSNRFWKDNWGHFAQIRDPYVETSRNKKESDPMTTNQYDQSLQAEHNKGDMLLGRATTQSEREEQPPTIEEIIDRMELNNLDSIEKSYVCGFKDGVKDKEAALKSLAEEIKSKIGEYKEEDTLYGYEVDSCLERALKGGE